MKALRPPPRCNNLGMLAASNISGEICHTSERQHSRDAYLEVFENGIARKSCTPNVSGTAHAIGSTLT